MFKFCQIFLLDLMLQNYISGDYPIIICNAGPQNSAAVLANNHAADNAGMAAAGVNLNHPINVWINTVVTSEPGHIVQKFLEFNDYLISQNDGYRLYRLEDIHNAGTITRAQRAALNGNPISRAILDEALGRFR